MAPEMFTLRTQTAALIVMRNFPNAIWARGRSRSEVRRDRNRAVTIRRLAEFLRRANSEAVGGKPDSSLSASIRRNRPGAATDVALRQTSRVDLWGARTTPLGPCPHVG